MIFNKCIVLVRALRYCHGSWTGARAATTRAQAVWLERLRRAGRFKFECLLQESSYISGVCHHCECLARGIYFINMIAQISLIPPWDIYAMGGGGLGGCFPGQFHLWIMDQGLINFWGPEGDKAEHMAGVVWILNRLTRMSGEWYFCTVTIITRNYLRG